MRTRISFLGALVAAVVTLGAGCVQFGSSTAAQGPVGMYRSSDKGENWATIANYPTSQGVKSIAGLNIYRIFTDPSDPNALYLGTRGQGMFYSYDNGDSWQRAEPLSGKFIYALAVDPSDKCTIYVSDGQHVYKTSDCSRSWRLVYSEERPTEHFVGLAVDFTDPQVVYGAELNGDILISVDGGSSWKVMKRFMFELQALFADPLAGNRIYVASYNHGLFRSDNRGDTWVDLSSGFSQFSEANTFYRLFVNSRKKNDVYWVSKYGILHSGDAGETWKALNLITPPGSVNIYAFAINPNNEQEIYYVATILGEQNVAVRSTFYKSMDGGKTWVTRKLPTNTVPVALLVHPVQNSMLFLGFTNLTQ